MNDLELSVSSNPKFLPLETHSRALVVRVPNLVSAKQSLQMSNYYFSLNERGYFSESKNIASKRRFVTNEVKANELGQGALQVAEIATKRSLTYSYNFTAIYSGGSFLDYHLDRDGCEVTMGIYLHKQQSTLGEKWQLLSFQDTKSCYHVNGEIGDAVIFEGQKISHGREKIPDTDSMIVQLHHFTWKN